MLIPCPVCGLRDHGEFTYGGDATVVRPDVADARSPRAGPPTSTTARNPRGPHTEYWHHVHGCRSWMIVERNTETHDVARRRGWSGPGPDAGARLMAGYRLPRGGTRIDRTRPLRFTLRRRARSTAFAGDTIASALLASGRTSVGRSFKYHRPRGVLRRRLGGAERAGHARPRRARPSRTPRRRSSRPPKGLAVRSQNAWPSLGFDVGAVNGLFAPFFAAGFYYKTFMGPVRARLDALRAVHPPRGRARPGELRAGPRPLRAARTPSATCSSSAAAPAGLVGRARGGTRRRARHPLRRESRCSAARSTSSDSRRRRRAPTTGLFRARSALNGACRTCA